MFPAGFWIILIGIIIIAAPELIAYFIGTIFILIGANILFFGFVIRRASQSGKSGQTAFRFGEYEIIRNRK